jgi:sec-independent protein translocase protein TatB
VFNLQGSELIIVLLLALVVLGPEKLPDAMRRLGKMYGELRKMSSGFQDEFRKAVDEPLREVRSTAGLLRDSVDLNKLSTGERAEKAKSAEMSAAVATPPVPPVAPADPAATPSEHTPSFAGEGDDPATTGDTAADGEA